MDLNGQTVSTEALVLTRGSLVNNNTQTGATLSSALNASVAGTSLGGAGNLTLGGVIAGTGNGALLKIGAGTLTLSGNNTFTRAINVNAGVLNIQSNNALGGVSTTTNLVASGAALQMENNITTVAAELFSLNGTGIANDGALRNISGTNTYAGLLTLAGTTRINSDSGTLNISNAGTILGPTFGLTVGGAGDTTITSIIGTTTGTLTKDGLGTLTLSGANTFTGALTVQSGTLQIGTINNVSSNGTLGNSATAVTLGNTGGVTGTLAYTGNTASSTKTFTLATGGTGAFGVTTSGQTLTLSGVIGGSGSLAKNGAGNLILSNTNTYAGSTTVSAGTLSIAADAGLGTAPVSVTADSLVLAGGTLATTANITLNSNRGLTVTTAGTLDVGTGTTLTYDGIATGTGTLTKSGTGTLTLTGQNTLSGAVVISGGTLQIGNGSTGGSIAGTTGITNNSALGFNRTGSHDYPNVISGGGTLTQSGTGTLVLTAANTYSGVTTINSGATLQIGDGISDGSIANSASLTNSGTLAFNLVGSSAYSHAISGVGALTQSGAGTLTLSGTNTYTGVTTISGGTLSIAADSGLGTAPVSVTAGKLVLSGGTLAASDTFTLSSNRGITTGGTLDVASGKTLTYGGIAAGTGILTKTGAGTLVLTGANSYTGATLISGGTLQIGDGITNGSLATNAAVTANGALIYKVAATQTQTAALSIGGSGTVTKSGPGTLIYLGLSTFSGAVTIDEGTLQIGNGTTLGVLGSATSITNNGTLVNKNNIANSTFSRIIGGSGAFVMDGGSGNALTMSGPNTYSGLTTVTSGTLKLGNASALGDTGTGTTVSTDAALDLLGQTIGAEALTLSGTGVSSGGALTNSDGTAASFSGAITLAANSSVGTVSQMTLSGVIGGADSLTKVGAGIVTLSGDNTYTGATTISTGTLKLGAAGSGANTPLGTIDAGTTVSATGALDLNGFTLATAEALTLNGTGVSSGGALANSSATAATYSGLLTLGSASSIVASSGNIVLSNTNTITGSGFDLTLDGSANGSSLAGIIGTGAGSVIKNGTGHWTLTGNNTYTGTTTVNAGTLFVNTPSGTGTRSGTGTGVVTVAAGGNLGGTGYVGAVGNSVVVSGGGSITAGDGTSGILHLNGGLTFSSTGTINIGTLSTSDASVAVAGTLLLSGASGAVTLALPSGTLAAGTYHLASYGTWTAGDLTKFSVTGPAIGGRQSGTLTNTAGMIDYYVVGTTPYWTGTVNSNWNTSNDSNWKLIVGDTATNFQANDVSLFNDSASGTGTVTVSISANVNPTNSTFNNPTRDYVLQTGTSPNNFGITSGSLIKSGAGSLTITNANSYSGGSTLNAGVLEVGDNSALGSGRITLNGGTLSSDSTAGYSLGNTLLLGGDTTLGGGSGKTGALTFISGVDLSVSAATITVPTGNAVTFSGTVSDAGGGLVKAGAGTLSLTHANTFTGGTILNAGVIQVGNVTALGTGLLTLNGGTLSSDGGTARTLANNLLLGGAVTLGDATNSGALTFSGTVDLDGSTHTITTASNVEFSGIISGANGGLSKAGSGTLTLSGHNTFTSDVSLSAGTLVINAADSLGAAGGMLTFTGNSTLQANADITVARNYVINSGVTATVDTHGNNLTNTGGISDTVLSTVGGSLTKTGTGTLTLIGDNTYTGLTTISAGTLKIGNGTFNGSLSTTANVVNNSALEYNLASSTSSTFGKAISGTGTFTKSGAGTLTLTGANSWAGLTTISTGTLQLGDGTTDSSIASSSGITNDGSLVFNVAGSSSYAHAIGGTGTLTKTGAGTLTLSGTSDYAGNTTLVAGTLIISSAASMGNESNSLVYAGNATLQSNMDRTVARGWIINSGATANADTNGYALTMDGHISGDGALNKVGAGTMTVTHSNTYTGTTTLTAGTLSIAADSGLGAVPASVTPGQLILSGGTLATTGSFTMDSKRGVALTALSTIDVATGISTQIDGIVAGVGGLTKNGDGTLKLYGRNTFDGNIDLHGGTLEINSALSLGDATAGNGDLIFTGNGTLKISETSAIIDSARNYSIGEGVTATFDTNGKVLHHSGLISGAGALTKTSTGTLELAGANTFGGKTEVRNGTLTFANGNASATADQALGKAATVDLGVVSTSSGVLEYTGSAAATLNKDINALGNGSDTIRNNGGGLLTLTGTLTKNGTVLTLQGGGYGITVNGTIAGSSANSDLVIDGGTITLDSANTYNGPTYIINGGSLVANVSGALPTDTSSAVIMDNTGSGSSNLTLGASQEIASLTGVASSTVALGSNTLTIGTTTASTTFAGVISGTGALVKDGASTQVLSAANTFSGTTTVSAGTLQLGNNLALQNSTLSTSGAGTITVTGFTTPTLGGLSGSTNLASVITTGYNSVTALTLNTGTGVTDTYSGAIANGAGGMTLTKTGDGTQVLSGENTYTGGTTVSAGTLVVNGSLSATGAVSVSGTLAGTGTIGGATTITSGGTHAPGAVGEVGTQNFSGDLTYADGSIFEWDLNASGDNMAGMAYDMVGAGGAISVDTSNTVFKVVFGPGVDMSDKFWSPSFVTQTWAMSSIFSKAFTIGSSFKTVQTSYDVSQYGSFTINGGTLEWSATVPEPSSVLAGLLLGAGLLRRRRN